MKTLLSWSGGKDSALALQALRSAGEHEVVGLLTTLSAEHQRVSMHGVRIELIHEQARCLGLPVVTVEMPPYRNLAAIDDQACPIDLPGNNTYEAAMLAAFARARDEGVEAIAFGDIFLEDLRDYRERLLDRAGLRGVYPLWQRDTRALLGEFIANGWRAVVVCTDGERLRALRGGAAGVDRSVRRARRVPLVRLRRTALLLPCSVRERRRHRSGAFRVLRAARRGLRALPSECRF